MHLVTRTFRSKPGRERELTTALRDIAVRMIRQGETQSVLVCQQSGDRPQLIWIENRGPDAPAAPSSLCADAVASWREILADAPAAVTLEFIDGAYRFPLPPCQIWNVEVDRSMARDSGWLKGVLELARSARDGGPVIGMSLYRTLGASPAITGFLALPLGIRPEHLSWGPGSLDGTRTPSIVWHRLSVVWTAGRLSSDQGSGVSFSRYPRTAFWARSRLEPVPGPGDGPEEVPRTA